jgi:hypothetical protein
MKRMQQTQAVGECLVSELTEGSNGSFSEMSNAMDIVSATPQPLRSISCNEYARHPTNVTEFNLTNNQNSTETGIKENTYSISRRFDARCK